MTGLERAQALQLWAAKHSKSLKNVIRVFVSNASSPTQRIQKNNEVIKIVDKWLSYPPEVRPNLYDTFADLLRDLGQKNPEKLLGPRSAPLAPMQPVQGGPPSPAA